MDRKPGVVDGLIYIMALSTQDGISSLIRQSFDRSTPQPPFVQQPQSTTNPISPRDGQVSCPIPPRTPHRSGRGVELVAVGLRRCRTNGSSASLGDETRLFKISVSRRTHRPPRPRANSAPHMCRAAQAQSPRFLSYSERSALFRVADTVSSKPQMQGTAVQTGPEGRDAIGGGWMRGLRLCTW